MSEMTLSSALVRVDRSVRPTYPAWMGSQLYPELAATGPDVFDLEMLIEVSVNSFVNGAAIHDHLRFHQLLPSCLNLQDLNSIGALGTDTFRTFFPHRGVAAWKDVICHENSGYLYVPYLIVNDGDTIHFGWEWLENRATPQKPIYRLDG